MTGKVADFKLNLAKQIGARDLVKKDIKKKVSRMKELTLEIRDTERALAIIQKVAMDTQSVLELHIHELCSLAMDAVFFDDPRGPYEVKLRFEEKRGQTDANIYFERNGFMYPDPYRNKACGGGAIDIASFALRIAAWSLSRPRPDNVMLLDEPFSRLKGDEANRRAIKMVQEVCKGISGGLQIIMISDERVKKEDIVAGADRVFHVEIGTTGRKSAEVRQI